MVQGASLYAFAQELSKQVDASVDHVLIGVSMGGMVAQELAGITASKRTIIISSWKGRSEMPWNVKAMRGLGAERFLNETIVRRVVPFLRLLRYTLGLEDKASQALGQEMLAGFSARDLRVMVAAVLSWNGPSTTVNDLVHIHGDKDRLMPIGSIKDPVVIKGGTHFMVFSKAGAVGAAVRRAL